MLRRLDWCPGSQSAWFVWVPQIEPQRSHYHGTLSMVYRIRRILAFFCQPLSNTLGIPETWPVRGQSFSPSRCGCHQRTHPKRTSVFRVCEPDSGASPVVWSHQIPEAVSTRQTCADHDWCSLKIRQGPSVFKFCSNRVDWTLSQDFPSHGPQTF